VSGKAGVSSPRQRFRAVPVVRGSTWSVQGLPAETPEAPVEVALPLSALAIFGAIVYRRRHRRPIPR
jgi:hypothetical protein